MRREAQLDDHIMSSNLAQTEPIEVKLASDKASRFILGLATVHEKRQICKKVFQNISIRKQKFFQRKQQIQQFQHENCVNIEHTGVMFEIKGGKEVVTRFVVQIESIESTPVSTFLQQKRQLLSSNFIAIIQQMVNLMTVAETNQIYHRHLNSHSILLIQSKNTINSQYFLKVCDWGYQNQICSSKDFKNSKDFFERIRQSSMFEYLHPELLFQENNLHLYKHYTSKYDIWSFGIIFYQMAFFKHPFQSNGAFSPQILHEYYKGKRKIQISTETLLGTLIQKMLSPKGFNKWSQIKDLLIQKAERVETDFLGINQLYTNQMNLICEMIQIYKLTAWSINNSSNCFWYENKLIMKQFLFSLLKLILLLHSHKYIERFGHRMIHLSHQQQKQYKQIGLIIQKQWLRKTEPISSIVESSQFFEDLDELAEFLLPLQLRIDDYSSIQSRKERSSLGARIRQSWTTIKIIKTFSFKILTARNQIQKYNRNIFPSFFNAFKQKN